MNLILIRENGPAFFRAAYYFFICNEANGFSHAFDDVSCAIVISCFVCDIAHVRVVTERVALFRARFPSVVLPDLEEHVSKFCSKVHDFNLDSRHFPAAVISPAFFNSKLFIDFFQLAPQFWLNNFWLNLA